MMRTMLCGTISLFLCLVILPALIAQTNVPVTLTSPGKATTVEVSLIADGRLAYAVKYKDHPILLNSGFGLDFKDQPLFAEGLKINKTEQNSLDEHWQRYWGKRKDVRNHYNEVTIELVESREPNRRVDLVFRAYDDGVAFRYLLPEQENLQEFKLTEERTESHFPGKKASLC